MSRVRRRRFRPRRKPPARAAWRRVQRALTAIWLRPVEADRRGRRDTQAAISKFERDRKLPVTGQMSDRLVKELTAMIGHPID